MADPRSTSDAPTLALDAAALPVGQLESLRFKAGQIIDSIAALQRTLDGGPAMPAWPDVLSKYNILLSQTHNFSSALISPAPAARGAAAPANPFARIALHPAHALPDAALDAELIPLLRAQQTTDVLRLESAAVRRLAAHLASRGSPGVLAAAPLPLPGAAPRPPTYADVLAEAAAVRAAHDQRAERAVRAVLMLRERYDWRQRVEVEVEEPEELAWDPRVGAAAAEVGEAGDGAGDVEMESPEGEESSDEDEVAGALVGAPTTAGARTPSPHEPPPPGAPLQSS